MFFSKTLSKLLIFVSALVLCSGCARAYLPAISTQPWEQVALPVNATLSDVSFTDDLEHGWLVGKNSTLLESTDGGRTWEQRILDLGEEQVYTFTTVSFSGQEGWITGQPSILLHTTDGGSSWSRVPLSEQLPGAPDTVTALGKDSAEMTTDIGAIYRTKDGGRTWQAMVQQAVGVLRNISRSPNGEYVAVSARGNFYSVWRPGLDAWEPHNRNSSRRLQAMGFNQSGGLWLLARGGIVQFNDGASLDDWQEPMTPEFATSWGLLDLAYRTPNEVWIAGGSGNLLMSEDGGKTWQKDRAVENVPSNFYKIVFVNPERGFVLGQDGTLLRYVGASQAA